MTGYIYNIQYGRAVILQMPDAEVMKVAAGMKKDHPVAILLQILHPHIRQL